MREYLSRHLQVLFSTLGEMVRTPLLSLNTILIIGVTMLLPLLLFIVVKSAEQISSNWQGRPQISIFLQKDTSNPEAKLIHDEISLHPAVALSEFISPTQALEEFRLLSGLNVEIELLQENPLPASIVVMPTPQHSSSQQLISLKEELIKIDGIEDIRLDLDWTDRFNALLRSAAKLAQLLSIFICIALILIVGTTIRLLIANRSQEIEITKLVGGSNAFVKRPFLYFGSLFGFLGALFALVGLLIMGVYLSGSVTEINSLFNIDSLLRLPSVLEFAIFLGIGTLLGWISARISVAQHLHKVRPR